MNTVSPKSNSKKSDKDLVAPYIFVVDDDKLVLATLKKGLIDAGYRVQAFSDPNLALEAYQH